MTVYAVNKRTKEHLDITDLPIMQTVAKANGYIIVETDADGWIPWDSNESPVSGLTPVEVKYANGEVPYKDEANYIEWRFVRAYRPILDADDEPESTERKPLWDFVPDHLIILSMDDDGRAFGHQTMPNFNPEDKTWEGATGVYIPELNNYSLNCESSLVVREPKLRNFEADGGYFHFNTNKAPEWDGEGLPPVGCKVKCYHYDEWQECEVLAHRDGYVVYWADGKAGFALPRRFRPVHSAEDRAVEKIAEIIADHSTLKAYGHYAPAAARALYRAGCRFPEYLEVEPHKPECKTVLVKKENKE